MTIDSFRDEYAFLSNFFWAPFRVHLNVGVSAAADMELAFTAPTVEHAFQALKSTEMRTIARILDTTSANEAKKVGRTVSLRPDWEQVKLIFMKHLVLSKFQQNYPLMLQLLETGDETLIEGNTWGDDFWGQVNGEGANHLGLILMDVRDTWQQVD